MRASSFVLIAAAALTQVVNATDGGGSQYMTVTTTCWSTTEKTMWSTLTQTDWETKWKTETGYVTITTTETDYVTTTETKIVPTTVFLTDTETQTTTQIVPTTITNVVTTTKVVPTTIFSTVTQVNTVTTTRVVPTSIVGTITQVNTVTITNVRPTTATVTASFTATVVRTVAVSYGVTSIQTFGVTNTKTAVSVSDHTATASITNISVVEKTITIFVTVSAEPVTISVPAPTTIVAPAPPSVSVSITGLVLCPPRLVNPTYTTSGIPDDWTWGCPYGKICKPEQKGCNFERAYPSDDYYCSPEECVDAPYIAPDTNLEGPWTNYTCGELFTPISGYFNPLPSSFGYDYNIFAFGGQTATPCSGLPVSQIPDGQVQAPTGPAVTQIYDGQPQAPTGAPVSQISDGQAQASVTKRAVLLERQIAQPAVPQECWDPCDRAGYAAQSTGKQYGLLCPERSSFSLHLSACNRCIGGKRDAPDNKVTPLIPSIGQFIGYCDTQRAARESSTSPELEQTTSPASTAARPTPNSDTAVPSTPIVVSPPSSSASVVAPTPSASSADAPAPSPTTVISSTSLSPPQVTQITDGQPQAPATPSAFTGAASSIVVPKDSWWLTILSFLLAFV